LVVALWPSKKIEEMEKDTNSAIEEVICPLK
jgi:hypothetical protein